MVSLPLLTAAGALTLLLWYCCRGLPPFVAGEVRANEAVVFYLLLMLARFSCIALALPVAGAGKVSLAGVEHAVLGVCMLLVFFAWIHQMDAAHAAANRWRAAAFFAVPALEIGCLFAANVLGRMPLALVLLLACVTLAAAGFATWTVIECRREARLAEDAASAWGAGSRPERSSPPPAASLPVAIAGSDEADRSTASPPPPPVPEDVAGRRDAIVTAVLAGDSARAERVLRGLLPAGADADAMSTALFESAPSAAWAVCETLGDELRERDPALARLCWLLALAGLEIERSQATAAGEAYAATETIRAVERRLAGLRR